MQLRRLELVGFKTFVDRTELEFHPGITAIVGPNGSGKSNIFDGIRWALGETNARMLRGARMDDVIFSGSATRRPTGLAAVSLTLDNSAGLLPVEFAEVTVSRAVTRGGEASYRLNGVTCRLRDIQMLFLGTGLGGRSYALIGQGEVDAVLRATPVERRHWLEEAAGLARHKRQRIEAERRLDHARVHLDRLTDLLDELTHQQEALATQAEAAAAHQAYTEELRELELALFADEARRLLGAARRLATQVAAEREQLAAAEARVDEAAAAVAATEAQLACLTAAWEEGQRTLLAKAETLSARAADVQALDAQAEGLRGRMAQLSVELARLADEHAGLSGDARALEQEAAEAEQRRSDLVRALVAAEEELTRATSAAEAARAAVVRGRGEALEVARALAQTRSDLAALQARADLTTQSVQAATQRAGTLGEAAEGLAADCRRAAEACDAARQALGAADAAVAEASRAAEILRREAALAAEAVHAAEVDEQRLRARLSAIEEAAAQFLGFEESTRELLLAARANPRRFPGLRGAVADLVLVPEAHRAAVAAALGERLHCVVVDEAADLQSVIGFIREHPSRHGTVLALSAARAQGAAVWAPGPDGDGLIRAVDVVESDDALRGMVEALLGDVVIAEDLAAAWRVFDAGWRGRVVTRDGAMLTPDGVVTVGGRLHGEAAPLGRGQVIAQLRADVAAAVVRRREAESRRDRAFQQAAEAERRLGEAQDHRAAAASALIERQQQLARLEAEQARVAQEGAAHGEQVRLGTAQLERLRAEAARQAADVAALETELRQLEAHLTAAAAELDVHEAAREAAAAEVAARRLAVVQAEGILETIRSRLADRGAALAELEARRAELTQAAEGAAADLAEVTARRDAAEAAYQRLVVAQAEAKAEVERMTTERARLRDELSRRQADHAAAADAARVAGAAVHKSEIRAAQADAELGAAAARLREQYGIALEDAAARRLAVSREEARRRLEELNEALEALGPVNLRAIEEHAAVAARVDTLRSHTQDIRSADEALRQAIGLINGQLRVRFRETFDRVNAEFGRLFERLFGGGQGSLELVEDDAGGEPGLEVIAQLPGKRRRPLVALSGGERALVALTLIFAMLRVHPSPFCIFDEVEAALDDANTQRFTELLRDLAQTTQVLIITHNKGTMAAADILYGVTMQEPGLSSIVSVRLVPPSSNGDRPGQPVGAPANGEEPASRAGVAGREAVALPAE